MTFGIKDALELTFAGSEMLADMESNGFRIDVPYLEQTIVDCDEQIRTLDTELRSTDVYKTWRKEYGERANLQSDVQLAHIFFDVLGYKQEAKTEKGRYKTDKASFAHVDHPFIAKYFERKELSKLRSTYLANLKQETSEGFFHPTVNLHTATTYRSSSGADQESTSVSAGGSLNLQNLPIRNPRIGNTLRRCFIPRCGQRIVEIDYSAIEARGCFIWWQDPAMIAYGLDSSKDMHRDIAAKMFKCDPKLVSKLMRQIAKNQMTFPLLYGSFYVQIAKRSWYDIINQEPTLEDGTPVLDWLARRGIDDLGQCDTKKRPVRGTWEHHIKDVEDDFYETFSTFAERKNTWWEEYKRNGLFYTLTGYPIKGIYSRNFLMNAPVQSICFHFLLWSMVELNAWLKRRNMLTKIIGTIHDCILLDVPEHELQLVLTKAERIMTEQVREHFPFIIVPLAVEVDCTPIDGSWNQKAPWIRNADGLWIEKPKKVLV